MLTSIPLPATDDPVDAPFWAGTQRSELLIQSCSGCGEMRFPPRPMCPTCQSQSSAWKPVSGRGIIWSFAMPSPPLLPAFEEMLPYVVGLVALEESPLLRIVGTTLIAPDVIAIGLPVKVAFRRYSDDVVLPCWVPGDNSV
tara:strand:- start:115931 stop:116353 length:423 start_codon:yes stop_codon:yes gene_type:complete